MLHDCVSASIHSCQTVDRAKRRGAQREKAAGKRSWSLLAVLPMKGCSAVLCIESLLPLVDLVDMDHSYNSFEANRLSNLKI